MTIPLHTDTQGKQCVDLKALYGARYRLAWEADGATKGQWPRGDWPWLRRVRCRHGYVYVVGGTTLGAVAWQKPVIGGQLRRLPGVLKAWGDIETVVHFPVEIAEAVFAILKPYRRRQGLSEAQRAVLAKGRRPFRRRGPVENRAETALESTVATGDDPNPSPEAERAPEAPESTLSRGNDPTRGGQPPKQETDHGR